MARRIGGGINRPGRMGFDGLGGGGAAAFTPAADPLVHFWWDPTSLTAGAVSSWTDRVGGIAATNGTGARQPVYSATAIGGAYPGVTPDGGDILLAAGVGAVVTGEAVATVTFATIDAGVAAGWILELSSNALASDGGFLIDANDPAGCIRCYARGTVSHSDRRITEALASVKVVSVGIDLSIAGAGCVVFMRVNGAAQAMTNGGTGSVAGTLGNHTFYFFARSGPALGYTGPVSDVVWRESSAQDAGLSLIETFVGSRVGLTI